MAYSKKYKKRAAHGAGEFLKLNENVENEKIYKKSRCCTTSKYNSRKRTRSSVSTS